MGRIYLLSAKYLNSIPYEWGEKKPKEGEQTNPPEDSVIQHTINQNDKDDNYDDVDKEVKYDDNDKEDKYDDDVDHANGKCKSHKRLNRMIKQH